MADSYRIKINLHLLALNMEVSDDEAREFLAENHLIERADGSWVCNKSSLELFDRDELVEVTAID